MTDDEVRALMVVIMGYDHRKPGELDLAAWGTASEFARWTLGEAVQAAHAHFAESTDYLMPGHITKLIRAKRQQPPRLAELELPAPDPAGQARITAMVAEVAEKLAWKDTQNHRTPALSVRCPVVGCHAAVDSPCTTASRKGRRQLELPHPSRVDLAEGRPVAAPLVAPAPNPGVRDSEPPPEPLEPATGVSAPLSNQENPQ